MYKRNSIRKYFTLILMFFTVVIGFSSWVIVGEKNVTVGKVIATRGVAYINNDDSILYTSLEAALRIANEGDIVHTIITTDPIVINYDCEVKRGVTLNITHEKGVIQTETNGVVVATSTAVEIKNAVETNIVKIASGVTLTNNGTIIIGGVLSGGSGGCNYLGHTSGNYASLILDNNSKIHNFGTIRCCGYIKDSSQDDSSILINYKGSNISIPFIIRDFRGGSATYAIYSKKSSYSACPFNLIELRNIQCKYRIEYGSNMYGYANIYAGDQHNPSKVYFVGKNSDSNKSFFNLLEESYVEIKYNTSEQYMKIDVYGGADIAGITLKVNTGLLGTISISTTDFYFPLSYKMHIYLYKSEKQTSATYNCNSQKIKIMPGGRLVVNAGVTLNTKSMNVYSNFIDNGTVPGTDYDLFRDTGEKLNLNPGYFEVKGKYNCDGDFGGKILYNNENDISIKGNKSLITYEIHSTSSMSLSDVFMIKETYNPISLSSIDNKKEVAIYLSLQKDWEVPSYTIQNKSYSSNMVIYSSDSTLKLSYDSKVSSSTFNGDAYENDQNVTLSEINKFILNGTAPSSGGGSGSGGCLLPGTLVTMSDGTKKPVEQIQPGDELKVFNHYTGEYDVSPVVFNDYEPKQDVNVINLEFSNGSNIGVVYEHGFFDLDLMKYVYIDEYNYNDYVGHRFYSDGNNIVTLNRAYITTQYTEVYSPVTAYHLNYFTEDILSMPGGIEGLFNIFEYDDDLKYNEELMRQDIETYGLYTYDDFKDYCTYEFYQAFPAEYLKVAVGKGYITFDEIIYLINRYKTKV